MGKCTLLRMFRAECKIINVLTNQVKKSVINFVYIGFVSVYYYWKTSSLMV